MSTLTVCDLIDILNRQPLESPVHIRVDGTARPCTAVAWVAATNVVTIEARVPLLREQPLPEFQPQALDWEGH